MKNITKKQYTAFYKEITTFLQKMNAIPNDSYNTTNMDRYTLNTKVGILNISFKNPTNDIGSVYSIFTRFENVEQAKKLEVLNMNEHSGKWNFHFSNPINILMEFKTEIENITK